MMSVLGQPPSVARDSVIPKRVHSTVPSPGYNLPSSEDSTKFAIRLVERACGGEVGQDDLLGIIMREKIDEKEEYFIDGTGPSRTGLCRSLCLK